MEITVRAVRRITLDSPVPVYDATSPKHHNFALANGVVVHNTAKVARHKDFQATFSLKGKPLNVMDTTKDKVNKNKEIAGIFAGIGLDLSKKNPIEHIQFGKIIFLADPDVDGCHINTLLMTLFWKYLPDLYKQGRIYMLEAPEYMAKLKGKVYFGPSVKDLHKQCGTERIDIRHIKGWGELEAEDMQPIAFDRSQRRMYRILPPRDKNGILQFQMLMGKKATYRQHLLGVVANGDDVDDDGKPIKQSKAKTKAVEEKKSTKTVKGKKSKKEKAEAPVKAKSKSKKTKAVKEEKPAKKSKGVKVTGTVKKKKGA